MILKTVLELSKKIDAHRQDILSKRISHSEVTTITQQLKDEIKKMKNIIDTIQAEPDDQEVYHAETNRKN